MIPCRRAMVSDRKQALADFAPDGSEKRRLRHDRSAITAPKGAWAPTGVKDGREDRYRDCPRSQEKADP